MKKIFLLIMLSVSVIYAAGTSAEDYRQQLIDGDINEYCFKTGETDYLPISDETGKKQNTKKEKNLICEQVIQKEGQCLEWETKNTAYSLDIKPYNIYETDDYEADMGSVLGTVDAMGKIKNILGGWKGYCESGLWTDFSWASDPLFWGGMALSYAAGSAADAAKNSGEVANASQQVADAASDLQVAEKIGNASEIKTATEALNNANKGYNSSVSTYLSKTYSEMGGSSLSFINANKCMISAGLDASRGIRDYLSDGQDGEACNPVDEICENDTDSTQNYTPVTLDETEYFDLRDQLLENGSDPDEIIKVLGEEDGIYTVVLNNPVKVDFHTDSASLKEQQEKFKQMQLMIDGAVTAAKFVGCFAGNVGGNGGASFDGKLSGENLAKMGLNMLAGYVPPPYGQMLQIALKLVDSFKSGNTCTDLEFANEMTEEGKRPVMAAQNKALKGGLSHYVYEKCVYKFFGSCKRTRYVYCNYDLFLTKILVEQFKVQLGKDWMHCSDVSLDELKNINFQSCPADIKNTRANPRWQPGLSSDLTKDIVFVDGNPEPVTEPSTSSVSLEPAVGEVFQNPVGSGNTNNPFDNPTSTVQYQQQCIDYTEFIENIKAQMGNQFDKTMIDDMFKDLGYNAPNITDSGSIIE